MKNDSSLQRVSSRHVTDSDRKRVNLMNVDKPIPGTTVEVKIKRYREGQVYDADGVICAEEPLEIMVNDKPYYLTMRLPGQDTMLAVGLCFTEGVISAFKDVLAVNHCTDSTNRLNVYLAPGSPMGSPKKRTRIVYASCGICGKELISDICTAFRKSEQTLAVGISEILRMQKTIESQQLVFAATGGTHMAGLFDAQGNLLAFAEDVGRHNALDKAIGQVLFAGKDREVKTVILSCRLSFEMIQKAARLGVEIIAGASAPTSSAADLARELHITLIGFLREGGANVYTFSERITAG
jgi:FdhD protein